MQMHLKFVVILKKQEVWDKGGMKEVAKMLKLLNEIPESKKGRINILPKSGGERSGWKKVGVVGINRCKGIS